MSMTIEVNLLRTLREIQESSIRQLENQDMVAYAALALREAYVMDQLRALWSTREKAPTEAGA